MTKAYAKVASTLMVVFNNLEIGQFFSASATSSSNFSWVKLGTEAVKVKCDSTISPLDGSRLISHLVSNLSAVNPASVKLADNFHRKTTCMRSSN
jgi:hypothetical protein